MGFFRPQLRPVPYHTRCFVILFRIFPKNLTARSPISAHSGFGQYYHLPSIHIREAFIIWGGEPFLLSLTENFCEGVLRNEFFLTIFRGHRRNLFQTPRKKASFWQIRTPLLFSIFEGGLRFCCPETRGLYRTAKKKKKALWGRWAPGPNLCQTAAGFADEETPSRGPRNLWFDTRLGRCGIVDFVPTFFTIWAKTFRPKRESPLGFSRTSRICFWFFLFVGF